MLDSLMGLDPVDAAIISVLQDEKWFSDGPPHWQVGKGKDWQRPSQTAADARAQRVETDNQLYRCTSRDEHNSLHDLRFARALQSLHTCCPSHRCGSGACPECTRALQRWFVESVYSATTPLLENNRQFIRLSIVPEYGATDPRRPKLDWEDVKAKLCQDLASVGIPWAIGGSDFSVNIDKENESHPVLQGQFWLLIEKPKGSDWLAELKSRVNPSGKIKRPINKNNYTGSKAQLAYGIKNNFNHRESFLKIPDPNSGRKPHCNTRVKKLRIEFRLPLMEYLMRIGLEGRLLNHNAILFNSQEMPQINLAHISNTKPLKQITSAPKARSKSHFEERK
jgi:hypothetical protein